MAGTALEIRSQLQGIEQLQRRIERFTDASARADLVDTIGAVVESQTRRRISEGKAAPDGTPWRAWSEDYAETRHGNHSLLENEGDLLDSIQYLVNGEEVEVGSNLVYAAIHQHGGEPVGMAIPQREYLGLSDDDAAELVDVVNDWIDETLEAA